MLDKSATRESFVVAAIATGGFREGTFAKLKYRHVREDLEANRIQIHLHIEAAITKGKYHDYDTFINAEASHLLKHTSTTENAAPEKYRQKKSPTTHH